ncbi:MAG: hypothetical protein ABEI77_09755 [Halorientalis sp.]
MSSSPAVLTFLFVNTGLFVVTGFLAFVSYFAYTESDGQRSFLLSMLGFILILCGGLVEPVYQLGLHANETLEPSKILLAGSVEDVLFGVGLFVLFLAITSHETDTTAHPSDEVTRMDGQLDYQPNE